MDFRDEQLDALARSGWNTCPSVAEGVVAAGLPVPDAAYLARAFTDAQWADAARAVGALRKHYAAERFADECVWGVVLVPDPDRLDTRGALNPRIRRDQLGEATADVVDERLPAGAVTAPAGVDWTLVATVAGTAGLSMGSYRAVRASGGHEVCGVDTRAAMTRQVWGARVLQSGPVLPDSPDRPKWTFTLFLGEEVVDGLAASGTVLHGKVRFRLGKPDRGIASARVCPAIPIN